MKQKADFILLNANIYTVDNKNSVVDAMVVRDGRILETGRQEDLLRLYEPGRFINADGRYVYPGFIDAHCHFYGLALSYQWIDLAGSGSFDEVLKRVKEHTPSDTTTWVIARGWDQNLWPDKKFPDNKMLNKLFPQRPVVLIRIGGHIAVVNDEALRRTGLMASHQFSPDEVEIKNGRSTGILRENALDYVRNFIPKPDEHQLIGLLQQAEFQCFSKGLTGVTDAGLECHVIKLMGATQHAGQLRIPIYAMLAPSQENIREYISRGPIRGDRLSIRSIKLYADGSLGSRTALLTQPYADDPGNNGVQVTSPDSIRKVAQIALDNDYQLCVHCIGDRAVREVLHIYGEFLHGKNDLRWRIEHAQVVDPVDIDWFNQYSIIPSVQATHATSDMSWADNRLGAERIKWAYTYHDLLRQNGWLPNGTDFPIEKMDPLLTFYAAVARKDLSGNPPGGFQQKNALSREEALKSITIWASKADFDEQSSGSLDPGKWANFVILDLDILKVPLPEIPQTNVLYTFLRGEMVYDKE